MSCVATPPRRCDMELHDNNADLTSPEPDTKRRKLRKGTRSCWDCKKRKVKCTFDAASDTACMACRRRGAPCIGQDQPEEEFQAHTDGSRDPLLDRIQRVEALLEHLIQAGRSNGRDVLPVGLGLPTSNQSAYHTPISDFQIADSFNPSPELCEATSDIADHMPDACRKLSRDLVKAFPCQEDIDVFCKSNYIATFYCHQIFTKSADRPEHEAYNFVQSLARIPDPDTTPPVLVAKRMIIFALFLQYFRSQHTHGLIEQPAIVMDRLLNTAVRLVTTNESIVCCVEGLECIILEGVFQTYAGNLRRAWIAFRKAIVIAQLMKMDLPNPPLVKPLDNNGNPRVNPKFMWFRIIYMDSHLSLMLGLPHGGQETNMEHETPGETLNCKLERAHTLIARRIIDRNRRGSFFQDFSMTKELDRELLNAAKALPDSFWSPPSFANIQPNTRDAFWQIMRLCDQLHHYNLIHLLHLPYLLRPDEESSYHTYAKITCVNASRDILTRFIAFRSFNCDMVSVYCRTADFFALMAAMTILLAHVDSHRLGEDDWRAHQRLSDRAMVEQLRNTLQEVGKHTNDSLSHKSADQLRRLLEIESGAARGVDHSVHTTVRSLEEESGELQLSIPYFGIIKIGREGITKDWPTETNPLQHLTNEIPDSVHVANHLFSAAGFSEVLHQDPQMTAFMTAPEPRLVQQSQVPLSRLSAEDEIQRQQMQPPGLAASVNDWAFQGVDAAFFDSLIQENVG